MPEYNVSGHYPFAIEADDPVAAVDRAVDHGGWEWDAVEVGARPGPILTISEETLFADWEDAEWVEDVGDYLSSDFESTVQAVADRIHDIHEEAGTPLAFCFGWVGVLEQGVDGAMIEAYAERGVYLSKYVELKRLTDDREAKGRAQVLAIASALLGDYAHLIAFANDNLRSN